QGSSASEPSGKVTFLTTLMLSSSRRAWSSVRTGFLPRFTTCFGPRTACAGLMARTWPTISQSNSMRIAGREARHLVPKGPAWARSCFPQSQCRPAGSDRDELAVRACLVDVDLASKGSPNAELASVRVGTDDPTGQTRPFTLAWRVAEVKFLTWTDDNLLRLVLYEELREDKPPAGVRRPVPHSEPI